MMISFGVMAAEPDAGSKAKWGSHVDADGKVGNKRSIGEADLFMPIRQDANTLVFADLRGRFDSQSGNEGNFGVGMRRMQGNGWNLGAYGYWDRRRSSTGNTFEQLTLGAEALGRDWDFRVNGYLPQGTRIKALGTTSSAAVSGAAVQITTTTSEERALGGYDAEVGWRLPLFDAESDRQLRLYAGGYHFSDSVLNVTGPRVRAEYSVASVQGLWKGAQFRVGAEAQRDGVRGGQTFLGVRLRIPFGAERTRHLSMQERRMTAPIVRDVDIVSQSRVASTLVETATTAGGQTVTVLDSGSVTGAALPGAVAAAGANSTVILSGTFNTSATTTLQSGQTVLGSGTLAVKTASGYSANLSLPGGTVAATIAGAGSATANPGFLMANNSTIDGLNVSLTRSGGTGAFGVYVDNVSGVTIRNSTITGSETGANASEGVTLNNATSITISNNTISAAAAAGQSGIALLIANGSSATVTGNTMSASGGANNYAVGFNTGTALSGSTGNVKSAGTCYAGGVNTGTLYFTDSSTCP